MTGAAEIQPNGAGAKSPALKDIVRLTFDDLKPARTPDRADAIHPQRWDRADRDSFAATAFADVLDRSTRATTARFTGGLSVAALSLAWWDWALHLATSPGKQLQLVEKAWHKQGRLATHVVTCLMHPGPHQHCIEPLPQDRRFAGEAWQTWPFAMIYQSFLLQQQWWHNATTGVRGVTAQHENVVSFAARQTLDMMSPSNFIWTNPEVLEATMRAGGMNLVRGANNFVEDWHRLFHERRPVSTGKFVAGRDVAITPGKVVFRNRLIELIQYSPATEHVRPEPILIVPAWIMKYYILDLSPRNSLVKFLTEQGFTVFMISWLNPGPGDRDLGMDDYRTLGVHAAIDEIGRIAPGAKIHATGYCLGGTLLAMTSAAMARTGDDRLATVTLLAAQTDFSEAGELTLFVNESQLTLLEDIMWEQGFLDSSQMAGAFQMLRSTDLVWSRMLHDYLMGERRPMFDLMAWNADTTRMPFRMHAEYLRHLFLDNDLAEGRCKLGGEVVSLRDISVPLFAVGTQRDHVAPWRSVFRIHDLVDGEVTFLLTDGGHNAGIVSEPGRRDRTFLVASRRAGGSHQEPEAWQAAATTMQGSWWPAWCEWLAARSSAPEAPPRMGAALCDAPGTFVHQT